MDRDMFTSDTMISRVEIENGLFTSETLEMFRFNPYQNYIDLLSHTIDFYTPVVEELTRRIFIALDKFKPYELTQELKESVKEYIAIYDMYAWTINSIRSSLDEGFHDINNDERINQFLTLQSLRLTISENGGRLLDYLNNKYI